MNKKTINRTEEIIPIIVEKIFFINDFMICIFLKKFIKIAFFNKQDLSILLYLSFKLKYYESCVLAAWK